MRWPFRPPHLTLKPPKSIPPKKKTKKEKDKTKNTKIPPKIAFQLSIHLFFGGCPKFPFFDNLAPKTRTQKHYKHRGFSKAFFWKTDVHHEAAIVGQKNKFRYSNYQFFCFFLLLQQQKTQKCCNPYFYSVLANQKREFSKLKLKTLKIEKPNFCTCFLKKASFEKKSYWLIIGHQKNTKWYLSLQKSLETTL